MLGEMEVEVIEEGGEDTNMDLEGEVEGLEDLDFEPDENSEGDGDLPLSMDLLLDLEPEVTLDLLGPLENPRFETLILFEPFR